MSVLEAQSGYVLPSDTPDGAARAAAFTSVDGQVGAATTLVSYASAGHVLIIGAENQALPVAEELAAQLRCTVLAPGAGAVTAAPGSGTGGAAEGDGVSAVQILYGVPTRVEGYLGNFSVEVRIGAEERTLAPSPLSGDRPYDLVLDLGNPAQIRTERPPLGYFAPGPDAQAQARAMEELPTLVGEFEKPEYVVYDPNICAHGASGLRGCTRCLDACPTEAIRSIGERIEVDAYTCQGGGVCATVCPTGAIAYAYPAVGDQLAYLRRMLGTYRDHGGARPVVLLHDEQAGRAWCERNAAALPETVIPCELEEIGSLGMDAWLALLAYGARVVVLCPANGAESVRQALDVQRRVAAAIVEGMGYSVDAIRILDTDSGVGDVFAGASAAGVPVFRPATFSAMAEKRTNIRLAVEHLFEQAPAPQAERALPDGAPFGEIQVDRGACTLCMACVSVCPASALAAGGDQPLLKFVEWNCVQCGLCASACPEDAITLAARFVYDPQRRRETRVLNEDAPFHCVGCGKAFATTRVIDRMRDKLQGHWMFQQPEAMKRLEMCEECRVKDMFKDGGGSLPM